MHESTLGRGIAVGLMHAALLRDVVRERIGDGLEDAWRERTEAELGHFYHSSVASDRGRLAAMAAHREGREPPVPATRAEVVGAALPLAMGRDAEAFRAGLEIIGCLAPADEVLARPGWSSGSSPTRMAPRPDLGRDELLRLVAA